MTNKQWKDCLSEAMNDLIPNTPFETIAAGMPAPAAATPVSVSRTHRVRRYVAAVAAAAVMVAGVGTWWYTRPEEKPPVTPATDDDAVTTTVDVPTEQDVTTTTADTPTTNTTTDGGVVAPTTTVTTVAPTQTTITTVAPTTGKTEPTKTTTTTAPTKLLITADEPDDYNSTINESSLNTSYISGALQVKMQEYSNLDVVYAVIVEVLPGKWDAFWESTEELKQFNKEFYDVYYAFEEEAMRLNPSWNGADTRYIEVWTDTMRANNEYWLTLVAERQVLIEKYSAPYQEYIKNQRFEVLKSLCDTEPIEVWQKKYGSVYFNGYYVELTAEQINILAEQGGYTFRLAMPDKIDYAYWEYLDQDYYQDY